MCGASPAPLTPWDQRTVVPENLINLTHIKGDETRLLMFVVFATKKEEMR